MMAFGCVRKKVDEGGKVGLTTSARELSRRHNPAATAIPDVPFCTPRDVSLATTLSFPFPSPLLPLSRADETVPAERCLISLLRMEYMSSAVERGSAHSMSIAYNRDKLHDIQLILSDVRVDRVKLFLGVQHCPALTGASWRTHWYQESASEAFSSSVANRPS